MAKILHMTEAAYEAQLTQRWLEGQAHGVEIAINRLRALAADFFIQGQDEKARLYRDVLPKFLGSVQGELERQAEEHERDHVEGQPAVQETRELIKTVLKRAADEIMDEDSWPTNDCPARAKHSYKDFRAEMQVIADNVEALAVDPAELLEAEE
ncbi:MAG: hypothetical protein ACREMO_01000 [Gemmatimonadales bacterium]